MHLSSSLWLTISALLLPSVTSAAAKPVAYIKPAIRFLKSPLLQHQAKQFLARGEVSAMHKFPIKALGFRWQAQCGWSLLDGLKLELAPLIAHTDLSSLSRLQAKFQRKFCCSKSSVAVREAARAQERANEEEIAKIDAERGAFLAEPDVTLEMLVQSLKDGALHRQEGVSQTVAENCLETVEWIIEEMQKGGTPDGAAARLRDTLEHSWKQFFYKRGTELKAAGRQIFNYHLSVLEADKAYWNQTQALVSLYNKELRWAINFFETQTCIVYQQFETLVQEFRIASQQLEPSSPDRLQQVNFHKEKLEGFYLALTLVIGNLDIRLDRLNTRIYERTWEDVNNGLFVRDAHTALDWDDYHSKIAKDFRQRERERCEKYRPLNQEIYQKLWTSFEKEFLTMQSSLDTKNA